MTVGESRGDGWVGGEGGRDKGRKGGDLVGWPITNTLVRDSRCHDFQAV